MAVIRWFLKWIVLWVDLFFRPRFKTRSFAEQEVMNKRTAHLTLYQFKACPFCVKVRWALRRMGLNVTIKDAKNDLYSRQRLLTNGGKVQVPCLHIAHKGEPEVWLYESKEIIAYLKENFGEENSSLEKPTPEAAES